jgi:Anti-sigma-K factor rskA
MDTSSDDARGAIHDPRFEAERLDHLVLLALGEAVPATFESHRPGCSECERDLAAISRTVALGREAVANGDHLAAPPPDSVWAGIAAEVGVEQVGVEQVGADQVGADQVGADQVGADQVGADQVGKESQRPRSRHAWTRPAADAPRSRLSTRLRYGLAAAAVVLAVVGVTGGYVAGRASDSNRNHLASNARLETVPGGPARAVGSAAVHVSGDGRQLTVTTTGLPLRNGFYEVWLYDPDRGSSGDMVAVGALGDHGRGSFTLPGGIELRDYHIVNISAQKYGGGASIVHAQSVLQGSLNQ